MTQDEKDLHTDSFSELYLDLVVRPLFPKAHFGSLMIWSTDKSSFQSVTLDLSKLNENYKDSNYFYTGTNNFIHYTSIENVINIINESAIRLYDFNNLDDPNEFSFLYKEIVNEIEHEKINRLKKQLFCFSLCEYDEFLNPDKFEMWRLYGKDGYGVGLVLGIESDNQDNWKNYMMSKLQYGQKLKEQVIELKKRHLAFHQAYKDSFHVNNFEDITFAISGLHKNEIYQEEKEVRFLYVNEDLKRNDHHDYHTDPDIYDAYNPRNIRTHYLKLNLFSPLYEEHINKKEQELEKEYVVNYRPKIKIKKIILGYRHKSNQYDLIKLFSTIVNRRYGEKIPVHLTAISEQF